MISIKAIMNLIKIHYITINIILWVVHHHLERYKYNLSWNKVKIMISIKVEEVK